MRFRLAMTTAILALSTAGLMSCDDEDEDPNGPPDTQTYEATLNGASEVPPVPSVTAVGDANFTVTTTGTTTTIVYTVTITSGALTGPVTLAHIHGPASITGTALPIVPLNVSSQGTTGVVVSGSFSTTGHATINMTQLLALLETGQTYVNLHTTANPNGEIRGQITD